MSVVLEGALLALAALGIKPAIARASLSFNGADDGPPLVFRSIAN